MSKPLFALFFPMQGHKQHRDPQLGTCRLKFPVRGKENIYTWCAPYYIRDESASMDICKIQNEGQTRIDPTNRPAAAVSVVVPVQAMLLGAQTVYLVRQVQV